MLLNRQTAAAIRKEGRVEVGPLDLFPERVLQFGSGNFLRAFTDWMFNEMNRQSLFNGRVIVARMLPAHGAGKLNGQDGLYTLLTRGLSNGVLVDKSEIITSISREIDPYEDWHQFISCAELPLLRFVVSNSTEVGIEYVPTGKPVSDCPPSFPAKLAAFLFRRYEYCGGARTGGLIIMPCELIEQNGTALRKCILQHAADWNLGGGFIEWLDTACLFINTLVDRIVPGYPPEDAPSLACSQGYEDRLLDVCEPFHLWVLEADAALEEELPFQKAGINVLWTRILTPYCTRKIRILNGAHTMVSLAAYLAGCNTVLEMINHDISEKLLRRGVFEEILPTLGLAEQEKLHFAEQVMERFRNPFIHHSLLSIASNSVSKFRVRVLPSLLRYVELEKRIPPVLAFSLGALIVFYRAKRDDSGTYRGTRGNESYPVRDNPVYLDFFSEQWRKHGAEPGILSHAILANADLWGTDLSSIPGLVETVAAGIIRLR